MLFRSNPGIYVPIKDTIESFTEVLAGRHDNLPEDAFYMVGNIETVLEKAARLEA